MKSRVFSSKNMEMSFKTKPWLPIFIAVGFALAFPIAQLLVLGQWESVEYTGRQMSLLYENLWRDGFAVLGTIVAAVAAMMNACSSFWYLYSKRKTDFYHSLPVDRGQMFFQKLINGIVFTFIPYMIMSFAAICIGAARGFFNLILMGMAVKIMIFHFLVYLFVYFCGGIIISLTGNVLMGVITFLGISLGGPVLSWIVYMYSCHFFKNFYDSGEGFISWLFMCTSPWTLLETMLSIYMENEWKAAGILLLLGFLAGIGAYFAYVKRPVEKAGKALVYSWIEPVFRIFTAVTAGLLLGFFAYIVPSQKTGAVWAAFGAIFGIVIVHGLLETFYHFDFRCFFQHKLQLLLTCVLVAAIAFLFKKDIIGYDTYIPDYNDLSSIAISLDGVDYHTNFPQVCVTEDNKYVSASSLEENKKIRTEFYEIEKSEELYETLKELIKEKEEDSFNESRMAVRYTCGAGKKSYRYYEIDSDTARRIMRAAFSDKEFVNRKYSFLEIENKYMSDLFIENEISNTTIKRADREEFLKNLMLDLQEVDAEVFMGLPCCILYYEYEGLPTEENPSAVVPGKNASLFCSGVVYIYPEFERTIAFLTEKGYSVYEQQEEIRYADVEYMQNQYEGHAYNPVRIRYEDEEQLQILKDALVPTSFVPFWVETEEEIVEIAFKDSGMGTYYRSILKEKTPDFILEDGKRVKEGLLESNIPVEE